MNLSELCLFLEVSRSGYHAHLHKPRRVQDAALAREVREAFHASRRTYGSPRLRHALRRKGLRHGKNRIARLMREQGLRVQQKRRFVPRSTLADKLSPVALNLLLERPATQRLNEVWLADICFAKLTLRAACGWPSRCARLLCAHR